MCLAHTQELYGKKKKKNQYQVHLRLLKKIKKKAWNISQDFYLSLF